VSITVDDWDDLSDARRRRDERAALLSAPLDDAEPAAADQPPVLALVPDTSVYLDDEAFGAALQNLKIPAYIAGANVLAWVAGRLTGVVELVGVAFFASIVLLIAAYLLREWQRDRSALICLAGALPLPITIIGYFN
jgi:hypothetical protein